MPLGGCAGFAGAAVRNAASCPGAGVPILGRRGGVAKCCGVACDAAWRLCRLCRRSRPKRGELPGGGRSYTRKTVGRSQVLRRRLRCRLEAVPALPAQPSETRRVARGRAFLYSEEVGPYPSAAGSLAMPLGGGAVLPAAAVRNAASCPGAGVPI